MAYVKQTWVNDSSPLNATRMNYMEDGIEDAYVPPGSIVMFAGAAAPTGWLLCDGSSQLRATYADLFTALGGASSPWGLPDGTHFNVPDLRGRIPVGLGTHADVNSLAENDGAALASRRPKHQHTVNDPTHTHTTDADNITQTVVPGASGGFTVPGSWTTGTISAASTGVTVGPQTSSPTDGPAYVVVNYIVKT